MHLKDKRILLGITGGIAAYKSLELLRLLRKQGAIVRVVMTQSSQQFVSPLSYQALSGFPVRMDLFDTHAESAMGHIELARWANLIVIAPTTANFIAMLAHGHASDLLSTLCLASQAPKAIVPAMNHIMWQQAATQRNINTLIRDNMHIWGPANGEQACGDTGEGPMLEPKQILANITLQLSPKRQNLLVVITAGPTHEAIDPVRFISNHSSGKMGYAIAQAFAQQGASVTLISGPVNQHTPSGVNKVPVISALDMHKATFNAMPSCHIFISCAAVADYRPTHTPQHKIKKQTDQLQLTLIKNPDILSEVASSDSPPFCVGFAAETRDLLTYADKKLRHKKIDMIAANLVGQANSGFGSDNNALTVLWRDGKKEFTLQSKIQLATHLTQLILEHYDKKNSAENS